MTTGAGAERDVLLEELCLLTKLLSQARTSFCMCHSAAFNVLSWQVAARPSLHFVSLSCPSFCSPSSESRGHDQTGCTTYLVLQVLADPGEGETPLMPVALMHASAACVAAGQVSIYLHEMPLKLAVQWPVLTCQDSCAVWLPAMGWELPGASM